MQHQSSNSQKGSQEPNQEMLPSDVPEIADRSKENSQGAQVLQFSDSGKGHLEEK